MMSNKIRVPSFILAIIGLVDSLYLTYTKLADQEVYCGTYGGCNTVNSSSYASIGPVPIALLGAGAFLTILVLLYLEGKGEFWENNSPLMIFGITLAGTIYSAYLTYIELAVLHAVCPYCVVSAVVITLLFILSIFRLMRDQAEAEPI